MSSILLKDLSPYYNRQDIIDKTIIQINKDLADIGLIVEFNGEKEEAYQDLLIQLNAVVEHLMQHKTEQFMQWLYKIDLKEKETKACFNSDDPYRGFAEAILKREFLKVILKEYFKQQQSNSSTNMSNESKKIDE